MNAHNIIRTTLLLFISTALSQFMVPPNPYMRSPFPMMPMQNSGMPGMMPSLPRLPGMPSMQPMPPQMMGIPPALPGGRLPMVVMPHKKKEHQKSKKKSKKRKKSKRKRIRTDSSSEDDESCSDDFRRNAFQSRRTKVGPGRQVLTPVVSYVTKDGYVVFQKKIQKEKAKDWLEMIKNESDEFNNKKRN